MDLDFQFYQVLKVKNSIRKDSLLIFSDGIETNPKNRILISSGLNSFKAQAYKLSNVMSRKAVNRSITEKHVVPLISGGICCLLNLQIDSFLTQKSKLLVSLSSLFLTLLAVKLNCKFYDAIQIENLNSLEYYSNIILFCELFSTIGKVVVNNVSK